jgi:hypothetical protein
VDADDVVLVRNPILRRDFVLGEVSNERHGGA